MSWNVLGEGVEKRNGGYYHVAFREVCGRCLHGEHSACRHHPSSTYGRLDESKPCQCEAQGHPVGDTCAVSVRGDWSSHRCSKPAKGEAPATYGSMGASRNAAAPIPACGVHLAAYRRRTPQRDREPTTDLSGSGPRLAAHARGHRASA